MLQLLNLLFSSWVFFVNVKIEKEKTVCLVSNREIWYIVHIVWFHLH